MAGVTLGNFNQAGFGSDVINGTSPKVSSGGAPKGNSSLLSRVYHGFADPFINTGKAFSYVPEAVGREIHGKPITDIQQKAFGTTNQGDIAKKIIGNLVQVGATVATPELKGAGLGAKVVQGAKIGAAAGGGNALANNQNVVKGAIEGGATGGALGGATSLLGKFGLHPKAPAPDNADMVAAAKSANGLKSPAASLGAKAQRYGTDLLGNKLNVSAKDAQKFMGPETVQRLQAEHGLTVDQAAKLHPVITGGEGVATTVHNAALEKMGNVNFKDFTTQMKAHINDPEYLAANLPDGASSAQSKNLNAVIDKYHSALNPDSGKMLTSANAATAKIENGTNAKSAMDIVRNLEKEGYANQASSSPTKQALSDLQLKMADTIKSRIYNAPGGQEALNAAKTETAAHLDALAAQSGNTKLSNVADAFRNAGSHEEFRNVSQPFVNAKALMDKTNLNNFANKGADSRSGGLFQTAKNAASKVVSPVAGKTLSKVGNALTGTGEKIAADHPNADILSKLTSNPQAMTLLRNAGIVGAAGAAANPPAKETPAVATATPEAANSQDALGFATPSQTDALGMNSAASGSTPAADSSSFSEQDLIASINNDPKNASTYIALYNALKPSASSSTTGKVTAQQKGLAATGLTGLQAISQEISNNPSIVTRAATPGQKIPLIGGFVTNKTGAGSYEANANQVLDALARLRTGAAMSSKEEAFYRNLLPVAGDSQETIATKLNDLQQAFSQFSPGK